jgi:hypothetical protein
MRRENGIEDAVREPLLRLVDQGSEMLFGLFMALTFVGVASVAKSGREDAAAMFAAAPACNPARGLVDAAMHLIRRIVDRGRSLALPLRTGGSGPGIRLQAHRALAVADRGWSRLVGRDRDHSRAHRRGPPCRSDRP